MITGTFCNGNDIEAIMIFVFSELHILFCFFCSLPLNLVFAASKINFVVCLSRAKKILKHWWSSYLRLNSVA